MTQGLVSLLAFTAIFSRQPKLITPIPDYLIKDTSEVIRQLADLNTSEVRKEDILAVHILDLNNRDEDKFINNVFKKNILLSLSGIPLRERNTQDEPGLSSPDLGLGQMETSFILEPGGVFAFHENVLPEYKEKVIRTMGSKFIASEGYLSSGWIFGDGVCHLASLMNWAASSAGMETIAKVKHDFKSIPGVPRDYWTSIRYSKSGNNSQNQNLYIINRFDYTVEFRFKVDENRVGLKILKRN